MSDDTEAEGYSKQRSKELIAPGEPSAWDSRGITVESAEKWGFTRSVFNGEPVRVFNYRNQNQRAVAQKIRFKEKDFRFLCAEKDVGLYGMHLWRDGGKKVVVTEGELDAISLSQMYGHKWPVVSVPTGAKGAKKALQANLKWLEQFEEIILMFDNDEAGQEAVQECSLVGFTPGKLKIATLPLKDANEMLMEGRIKETTDAVWSAKTFRPDGILSVNDIMGDLLKPIEWGLPWCFEELTNITYGRRYGEIYALGAGTGVGKTDFLTQQIGFDMTDLKLKVGAIFLEQKPVETAKRVAGKIAGKSFHIPDSGWKEEELTRAAAELEGNLYFYDSWGQTDWEIVKGNIRYMNVSLGIRVFYLDHLTALADTGDEKGSLEQIMKEMAGLANELQIIIHFVSHLTTPDGKPHEEGGRVMIRHFKGSRAIGFWSYFMFGLERDQQNENVEIKKTTIFRILKDRYTGRSTGETLLLGYNSEESRLFVRSDDPFAPQVEGSQFQDETGNQDF